MTHWQLLPAHIAEWGPGSWEKLGNPRKNRKILIPEIYINSGRPEV